MLPELVSSTSQGQFESESNGKRHLNTVRSIGIPQVHNLSSGSNEVQSISTAFKKWQTSAPTLHQYRPDEIEVVIHRRTGKVDRVRRSNGKSRPDCSVSNEIAESKDESKAENFHQPQIQFSEYQSNDDLSEGKRSPLILPDDQITTEDRNESFVSSLEDRSNDSFLEEDDEDQSDCHKCRLLRKRLDETTEKVNARQNLIVALTSLNNDQLEVGKKLKNEIRDLNQRLMNTELIYSQNMRTIKDSLQLATKSQPRNSHYSCNELRLMQLIEKSRSAFNAERLERGDPDGMDSAIAKDASLEKIQRALTNMSDHLDSSYSQENLLN